MRNRQMKRWCDTCSMMVHSLGHEHGQAVQPPDPELVGNVVMEQADYDAAIAAGRAHVLAEKKRVDREAERITLERLGSAVERATK